MKPTAADIAHAPDALIINHVAPGEVPYDVPDGRGRASRFGD
jgi:hypothetical protein